MWDGETVALDDLRLGTGPVELTGRVLDTAGQPFEGLAVACVYTQGPEAGEDGNRWNGGGGFGLADAEGRFRITAVEQQHIFVYAFPAPGTQGPPPILQRTEPVFLDLTGRTGPVELGDIVAERAGLYRLEGRVAIDPDWARANGVKLHHVELFVSGEVQGYHPVRRPGLDAEGGFAWSCPTPQDRFTLTVSVDRVADFEPRTYDIAPVAGAVDPLVVELP